MKAKDFLTTLNDMFSADYFQCPLMYPEKGISVSKNILKDYYLTYDIEAYDQLITDGHTAYLLVNSFQNYFDLRGSRNVRYFPHFNHPGKKVGPDNIKENATPTTVAFGNIDFPRLYNHDRVNTKAQVQTLYDYCEANGLTIEVSTGNRISDADRTSMVDDITASFPNIIFDPSKFEYCEKTFQIGKTADATNSANKFTFSRTPFQNHYHFEFAEMWYAEAHNHINDQNIKFLVDEGYLVFIETVDGISKYTIDASMADLSAGNHLKSFKNILADMTIDLLEGIDDVDEFTWALLES